MTHFLDINQLAEEAAELELYNIVVFLEEAATRAANAIVAKRRDMKITVPASNEPGFGGLCVGFGPIKAGDECPEDFKHYDNSSAWVQGEED